MPTQKTPNGIKSSNKTKKREPKVPKAMKLLDDGSGLQALAGGWISYWSDHSNSESPHYISSQVGLIGYSTLSLAVPWILKDIFEGFFCLRWDGRCVGRIGGFSKAAGQQKQFTAQVL